MDRDILKSEVSLEWASSANNEHVIGSLQKIIWPLDSKILPFPIINNTSTNCDKVYHKSAWLKFFGEECQCWDYFLFPGACISWEVLACNFETDRHPRAAVGSSGWVGRGSLWCHRSVRTWPDTPLVPPPAHHRMSIALLEQAQWGDTGYVAWNWEGSTFDGREDLDQQLRAMIDIMRWCPK